MFRRLTPLLIAFLVLTTGVAHASTTATTDVRTRLISQLRQQSGGNLQLDYHRETGAVRFLATDAAHPIARAASLGATATAEQASRAFLSSYGALFGLNDQAQLTVMHNEQLAGRSFVRFQQRYQGVPVLGGELIVQTDARRNIISANGETLPGLDLSVTPRISAAAATQTGLAALAKTYKLALRDFQSSQPQLWIYNPALLGGPGLRQPALVWRMEVTAPTAGEPIRELLLIDAQIGVVALHFNQIAEAKQRHVCDNKSEFDLDKNEKDNCPASKYVRSEGQGPTGVSDVDLAYDYAGLTYDYYQTNFGRDSLDGKGLPLISLVNYCHRVEQAGDGNCPYQNAFWDGQQMTYGEGYAAADDVVGHELTHGFTEFTSHLFYYYQAGAINESLSDVFGELIDQTDGTGNDSPSVKWQLGEDLPAAIGVVRNMQDPTLFDNPDTTSSSLFYSGPQDSGGVHTNSGVNNKASYLMTDGGSFNGVAVSGIGAAKTGAIYYAVETAFLTSGSDYQDLYSYLQAACSTLASAGAHGITAADCAQVKKAGQAVEMGTTPELAPVPEAAICAPGQTSSDVFFDDLESPAAGNWVASATSGAVDEWYYPVPAEYGVRYTTSGVNSMWGYDQGSNIKDDPNAKVGDYSIAMTRDVQVPANAFLHFRHSFDFENDANYDYDGGVVEYSTNGGSSWNDAGALFDAAGGENGYNTAIDTSSDNPLHGRDVFGNVSQGYYSSRADLSALAGQPVRFRFRIGTDAFGDAYGWFIDDVRLYSCTSTPPSVTFRTASQSVGEGAGSVSIEALLSGAPGQDVSVPFTVSGSAVAGTNYTLLNSSIVIPAGYSAGRTSIQIIDNALADPGKTLIITLGTPTGATLGGLQTTTITIQDNDTGGSRRLYIPLTARK